MDENVMAEENPVIQKAATYVSELFKEELSKKYVYHNLNHTFETADACREAVGYYNLNEQDITILLLAALFHDTGYIKTYQGHEEVSKKIAADFLNEQGFDHAKIEKVESLIESTRAGHEPGHLLEEILHDADHVSVGRKRFFRKAELLRIEWEFFLDRHFTEREWAQEQQEFILAKNFYTEYFRREYGPRREKNIEKQFGLVEKAKKKKEKSKAPKRGTETMYRATYRNHINLSSIADEKANMMISINTIIMSIIITVVGGGFTLSETAFVENMRYTVPICILLLGSLVSVIYAIMSARPNVTQKDVDLKKIRDKKSSVLFFGNFSNMKLPDFINNLQELRNSKEMLYDNMTIDLYYLGLVLTQKYRLLRISYNVFMTGLVVAVLSFMAIFFYTQYMGPANG
ncbi:Pycsar system effector family protein [Nafulsella turpanensis]|uniref:Pycsar system effector family protein n=1 Tax=Nafulsella turpanensis TaxID=1265690 RepID=UPI000347A23C|nr:Pycsar system effector family protein [Nafulsella turpanensis]